MGEWPWDLLAFPMQRPMFYAEYFLLSRVNLTCVHEYYIGLKNILLVETHR